MKKKITVVAISAVAALVLAGCGKYNYGNNNQNQNQNQNENQVQNQENAQMGNPPAEMTSACEGKSEGDSCEVAMPQRDGSDGDKVAGTCQTSLQGDQLVCRPDNMPENGGPQGGGQPGGPQGPNGQ
jgi:hypothetical protein